MAMPDVRLAEVCAVVCLLAAIRPLWRASRIHYFEHPAKQRAFHEWVERTYPEVWTRLPKWERKYLNPEFGIGRIRREHLITDPEFERRREEVNRLHKAVLRPTLTAAALALLGAAILKGLPLR
jgi:hypothetical protein